MLGRVKSNGRYRGLVWITDDIAVSSAPTLQDWPDVAEANIRAVVELREDAKDDAELLRDLGIAYVRLAIAEGDAPTIEELQALTDWILERIEKHGAVLIHCREGRGRSSLVACATLIRMGFSSTAAYAVLRRAHPMMALSAWQARTLENFARSRAAVRREPERAAEWS